MIDEAELARLEERVRAWHAADRTLVWIDGNDAERLIDEVRRLQEENKTKMEQFYKEHRQDCCHVYERIVDERHQQRVQELEAALERYGCHDDDCDTAAVVDSDCVCGFREVRAALGECKA